MAQRRVGLDRDILPPLAKQIPPAQHFLLSGVGHLLNGCLDLLPDCVAGFDLCLQFFSGGHDPLNSPRQLLAVTAPAGHPGQGVGHTGGPGVQRFQFLHQFPLHPHGLLVSPQPPLFVLVCHPSPPVS